MIKSTGALRYPGYFTQFRFPSGEENQFVFATCGEIDAEMEKRIKRNTQKWMNDNNLKTIPHQYSNVLFGYQFCHGMDNGRIITSLEDSNIPFPENEEHYNIQVPRIYWN